MRIESPMPFATFLLLSIVDESQMRIERFRQLLAFQFFLSAMNLKGELKVRSNV